MQSIHCFSPPPLQIHLPTGKLQIEFVPSRWAYTDLLDFAARANPKRAFLFLSKVLGKHYPSDPQTMAAVHQQLAAALPPMMGGVVFIGMAETATGLGQGVFEAWLANHSQAHALYMHTTRYRVQGVEALSFEETHSHAPRLFLHSPAAPDQQAAWHSARQLVLIDDELSTGNTFINLVHRLKNVMPYLAQVHIVTLVDLMGPARRTTLPECLGYPCSITALLQGTWTFEPCPNQPSISFDALAAQCHLGDELVLEENGYGRAGRAKALTLPQALVTGLAAEPVQGTTLVLGVGEWMHSAFVLGKALADHGVAVCIQATTRSPILLGGGVQQVLTLPDPYGEALPYFLYNVAVGQYARVLICHETPLNAQLRDLALLLRARLVHFQCQDHVEERWVC